MPPLTRDDRPWLPWHLIQRSPPWRRSRPFGFNERYTRPALPFLYHRYVTVPIGPSDELSIDEGKLVLGNGKVRDGSRDVRSWQLRGIWLWWNVVDLAAALAARRKGANL